MTNVTETMAILLCIERSFVNERILRCDELHIKLTGGSLRGHSPALHSA
jgi:hypothetical protein